MKSANEHGREYIVKSGRRDKREREGMETEVNGVYLKREKGQKWKFGGVPAWNYLEITVKGNCL